MRARTFAVRPGAGFRCFLGIAAWGILLSPFCQGQAMLGAGYRAPQPIEVAPGQVITLFVRIPGKTAADLVTATPPLPTTLGGFAVVLRQTLADPRAVPILSAGDAQSCSNLEPVQCDVVSMVTVQIPYELTPNVPRTTVPLNFARLEVNYNGSPGASIFLNPVPDRIHVLNSCDVAANLPAGECVPVIARPDGSLVSRLNPARTGEQLTVALVGIGWTEEAVTTGAATPASAPLADGVSLTLEWRANAGAAAPDTNALPAVVRLRAGAVGIYEVQFTAPALSMDAPLCSGAVQSNLTLTVARTSSYDGVGICVAPPVEE